MQLTYVWRLACRYLIFASTMSIGTFLILLGIRYFYKKNKKIQDNLSWYQMAVFGIIVFYFSVVLGATIFARGKYETGQINLHLFSTYRNAWYTMEMVLWRNLLWNICMFVPIGFLLPMLKKRFRVAKWTYFGCFLATFFIETIQFIFRCGIFEIDDLFNNTLGGVIGYGLWYLCVFAWNRVWRLPSVPAIAVLLYQLPLLLTLFVFGCIATVYQIQFFGNISCEDVSKYHNKVNFYCSICTLEQDRRQDTILKVHKYDKNETENIAKEVFWNTGKLYDHNFNYFDNYAMYYSRNNEASVKIWYLGGNLEYADYTQQWDSHGNPVGVETDASTARVTRKVEEFGLDIPSNVLCVNHRDGSYEWDILKTATNSMSGNVTCVLSENDIIASIQYYMLKKEKEYTCTLYSEKEIFEQIKKGKYKALVAEDGTCLGAVKSDYVCLEYMGLQHIMDTKGYFQPIYHCVLRIKDKQYTVDMPAIVSYKS